MITEFVQTYKNNISGRYDANRKMTTNQKGTLEMSGGAKIKMNFYNQQVNTTPLSPSGHHQYDLLAPFQYSQIINQQRSEMLDKLHNPALAGPPVQVPVQPAGPGAEFLRGTSH